MPVGVPATHQCYCHSSESTSSTTYHTKHFVKYLLELVKTLSLSRTPHTIPALLLLLLFFGLLATPPLRKGGVTLGIPIGAHSWHMWTKHVLRFRLVCWVINPLSTASKLQLVSYTYMYTYVVNYAIMCKGVQGYSRPRWRCASCESFSIS